MPTVTGSATVDGVTLTASKDYTLNPAANAGPAQGQPAESKIAANRVLYTDNIVAGNPRATWKKIQAAMAGTPKYLITPNGTVTLPPDGFVDLDSSWLYMTNFRGMGPDDGGHTRFVAPQLTVAFGNQATTTQYTIFRQNQGPIESIWGCSFDSAKQTTVSVFHGMTFYKPQKGWTVKDCTFQAFGVGTSGTPPTETFAAQFGDDPNAVGTTDIVARVDISGKVAADLPGAGQIVGGVGVTAQRSDSTEWYDVTVHDIAHGSGGTLYQVNGFKAYRFKTYNLPGASVPLNCEEVNNVYLLDCDLQAGPGAVNVTYSNYGAWSAGSVVNGGVDGSLKIEWTGAMSFKSGQSDGKFYVQNWAGSQTSAPTVVAAGKPAPTVWVDHSNVHHALN